MLRRLPDYLLPTIAMLVVFSFFMIGCSSDSPVTTTSEPSGPDTTAPTLVSTDPVASSTDIGINQIITAYFSEALDPATINGNITINPGIVTDLIQTGSEIQIVHNPFDYDTEITITFATGIADTAGNQLASQINTHYWTANEEGEPGPCGSIDFTGYYENVDTTSRETLRTSLHAIIDDHLRFPYTASSTDTWNVLEEADQDPNDTGRILDVYGNFSYIKHGGGNSDYNREHSWPKSYGFPDDGSRNYPYTDCHHLFLCYDSYNSSRGNKPYGIVGNSGTERPTQVNNGVGGGTGSYPGYSNWYSTQLWETWTDRRGDVARAMFYMDVRYEGGNHGTTGAMEPDLVLTNNISLIVVSGSNTDGVAYMGILDDLVQWHLEDPVDAKELRHNEVVYSHQGNRNPFVDHPELVECLFGQ